MTQEEFYDLKRLFVDSQLPYKVVDRSAIKYVGRTDDLGIDLREEDNPGRNVISVFGTNVLATNGVTEVLDDFIGFSGKQHALISKTSGEEGVRDFRNYLAAASTIVDPTKLALVANPENKTIISAIPVKEDLITAENFFDFAEMFMDYNDLHPTVYETGGSASAGITLHMGSNAPEVRAFAPGEDTLVNSYYLSWNPGQIKLGRYFERLVCENGMTTTVNSLKGTLYSLNDDSVRQIIDVPKDTVMLDMSYDKFSEKALVAMNTRASLAELDAVGKMLKAYRVSEDTIRAIAPYAEEREVYSRAGYDDKSIKAKETVASMSVWDLFNKVTDFASHNAEWEEKDNRRTLLAGKAVDFLNRERDIRNYVNVYAQ